MLTTLPFRVFRHPVSSLRIYTLKYTKNMNLLFVSCGFETWSVALKEGYSLSMFESRVLSRIFGPNREKVA